MAGLGIVGFELVERLAALDEFWRCRHEVTAVGKVPWPAYDLARLTESLEHRETAATTVLLADGGGGRGGGWPPAPRLGLMPAHPRFVPPDGVLVACGFPSRPGLSTVMPCRASVPPAGVGGGVSA